jgi:cell division protein FtsA
MLAFPQAVTTPEEREQGSLIIDLGAGSTKWVLYQDNIPRYMKIIPIGGDQLTADIALALKTSLATAEVLKVRHGAVTASVGSAASAYHFYSDQKSLMLDQKSLDYLNQVMTMRLEEILSLVLE